MTFTTAEFAGGRPIELYEFRRNDGIWRYTNYGEPVASLDGDGLPFEPVPAARASIRSSGDTLRDDLTLTFPRHLGALRAFLEGLPTAPTYVVLRRQNLDATGYGVIWTGRVTTLVRQGPAVNIKCQTVLATGQRPGLRLRHQRNCPYTLYDTDCGVAKAGFAVAGTVTAINGKILTVTEASGFADHWFAGGYAEWGGISRMVVGHLGDQVVLISRPPTPAPTSITLYRGCDRRPLTCDTAFSNLVRFGGEPYLTPDNPMDGSNNVFV